GLGARAGYETRSNRRLILQPSDEQPQIACSTTPVTTCSRTPPKEQRHTFGVCLRCGLRPIAPKAKLPQKSICDRLHLISVVVDHRPVAVTGWHPDRECSHRPPPSTAQRLDADSTPPKNHLQAHL